MRNQNVELNPKAKDRRKVLRSIFQFIVIIIVGTIFVRSAFLLDQHETPEVERTNKEGFVALSYFGVSRGDSSKYVSRQNLERQLTLLKKQGFETISQEDLINFYTKREPLPEKALFLFFEDGRTDSSIFAQRVLEKLDYKATMFTYADKMDSKDFNFLNKDNLKLMTNSRYWELGTNGYRLTYINVYNDQGEFLGSLGEEEIPNKMMIEYYNHYLMDFIRDEFMIPAETAQEMKERINTDYTLMKNIYEEYFGEVPKAYAIMHANTLYNNMDPLVEEVNDENIKKLFKMHFNLESMPYNDREGDLFNLSRLQVSPDWSTNHLMMTIQKTSKVDVAFDQGDEQLAKKWRFKNGAGEFQDHEMILTSKPSAEGVATLKETLPKDYQLSFKFAGNVVGEQSVLLNYNPKTKSYVRLLLKDNDLFVMEKLPGKQEKEILQVELDEVKWSGEYYSFNKATQYTFRETQQVSRIDEEAYPRRLKNERSFKLKVEDKKLYIQVDHHRTQVTFDAQIDGRNIAFTTAHSKQKTEYQQYDDDIYDTILRDLEIKDLQDQPIYVLEQTKFEKLKYYFSDRFNRLIDFFIENF